MGAGSFRSTHLLFYSRKIKTLCRVSEWECRIPSLLLANSPRPPILHEENVHGVKRCKQASSSNMLKVAGRPGRRRSQDTPAVHAGNEAQSRRSLVRKSREGMLGGV
eukprot:6194479-Pleurochrysis_carterae.AAC.2